MFWKLSIGTAVSSLVLASAAHAQSTLFNVRVGPTFASRDANQTAFESKGEMSMGGGGGFRFGSGPLTINPSVMIVGKVTSTGDRNTTGESRLKLQYIEFPVLAALKLSSAHRIQPFIEAGPVLSMETRCRIEFVLDRSKDEVGCDITEDETFDRHKIDFGARAGGGLDFRISEGRLLSVNAHYTHGFSNINASDNETLKIHNRAVSFYLAYYFPFKPDV